MMGSSHLRFSPVGAPGRSAKQRSQIQDSAVQDWGGRGDGSAAVASLATCVNGAGRSQEGLEVSVRQAHESQRSRDRC